MPNLRIVSYVFIFAYINLSIASYKHTHTLSHVTITHLNFTLMNNVQCCSSLTLSRNLLHSMHLQYDFHTPLTCAGGLECKNKYEWFSNCSHGIWINVANCRLIIFSMITTNFFSLICIQKMTISPSGIKILYRTINARARLTQRSQKQSASPYISQFNEKAIQLFISVIKDRLKYK